MSKQAKQSAYLQEAFQGKNEWWRYGISWGGMFLVLAFPLHFGEMIINLIDIPIELRHLGIYFGYFLFLCLAMVIVFKVIHKQSFRKAFRANRPISGKRLFLGSIIATFFIVGIAHCSYAYIYRLDGKITPIMSLDILRFRYYFLQDFYFLRICYSLLSTVCLVVFLGGNMLRGISSKKKPLIAIGFCTLFGLAVDFSTDMSFLPSIIYIICFLLISLSIVILDDGIEIFLVFFVLYPIFTFIFNETIRFNSFTRDIMHSWDLLLAFALYLITMLLIFRPGPLSILWTKVQPPPPPQQTLIDQIGSTS